MSEGFRVAEAYVSITPDDTGLEEKIRAAVEAAAAGQRIDVKLGVDANDLRGRIDAAVGTAAGEKVTVGLNVDGTGLRDKIKAETDAAAHGEEIKIPVKPETSDFETAFAAAMAEADQAGDRAAAELRRSFNDVANSARTLRASADDVAAGLDPVETKATTTGRSLDDLGKKASSAGSAANTGGGGFLGMSGGLTSLVAAAMAAAPALAALPALLGAAGLAAVTLRAAFGGVSKALQDHAADSAAAGQSGASLAATTFANATAIRSAEQAITDARRQSAIAAQNSADAVRSAQQGVMDAERNAAQATQASAAQIVSAQQSVTNALYQQQQAEQSLAAAKASAQDQIDGLNNSEADSKLAVESATNNVTKAQDALAQANAQYGTGSQQAKDADLALRQAKQQVIDAQLAQEIATKKAIEANQEGVNGIPSVVNAQHAAEQAALAVAAAQQAVADATAKAEQQQITSAESVAKAQQALAKAQLSADQQKTASTETVQKAVQALSDMQEQQRLAAAASSAASSATSGQFQKDMAAMSPAARALTDQVLSMKGAFDQLKDTAQTATLPGFTTMLRDSLPLFPIFNTAVSDMGGTLNRTAVQFGDLFKTAAFQSNLTQFLLIANQGFGQFASALAPMFSSIISVSVRAAPILDALGVGVHNLMVSGLPNFFAGLTVNASGAGLAVGGMLGIVNGLLGPVGRLAGMISGAAGPALAGLVAPVSLLARSIDTDLMPVMPQLQAALLAVVGVIDQLVPILQPTIAMFGTGLADALHIVTPLLNDLAGFLQNNAPLLKTVAEGIMLWAVATKALSIEQGIAKFVTTQWSGAMKLFADDSKAAGAATKLFGEGTSGALMGIGKAIPVLGAVAIGAAALGSWLGTLGQKASGAVPSVAAMTSHLLDLASATDQTSEAASRQQASFIAMADHMHKGADAAKGLDGAFANLVQNGHATDAAAQVKQLTDEYVKQGGNVEHLMKDLPQYQAALEQQSLSQQLATSKTKDANTALGGNADATKAAADASAAAATTSGPFAGLALRLTNVDQAGGKTVAQLQNLDSQLSKIDAARNQQTALDAVTKSMNDLKTGAAGADSSIKDHSASLQGNTDAALANRAQLSQNVAALRDFYDKQIAAGVGVDAANGKFNDQAAALEQQAVKTYGSKEAVDDFLKTLGLVPATTTTKVVVDTKAGEETIKTIQTSINSLTGKKVTITIDHIFANGQEVVSFSNTPIKANADGGPVGVGDYSWVGERGPEIVQFTRPGVVIPNEQVRKVGGTTAHQSAPAAPVSQKPTVVQNFYGTSHPTSEQSAIMRRELALLVHA